MQNSGDGGGGVAELLRGGLGVDPLGDEGRDRLAERMGRDPVETDVLGGRFATRNGTWQQVNNVEHADV
jgi:hypothetical protein